MVVDDVVSALGRVDVQPDCGGFCHFLSFNALLFRVFQVSVTEGLTLIAVEVFSGLC